MTSSTPDNHDKRVMQEAAEDAKQGLRRVRGEDMPAPSTPDVPQELDEKRKILSELFDDVRIAHANDKSPAVCKQYIDRAEALLDRYGAERERLAYVKGVKDGWNQSGEGWNAEYPGGKEDAIVQACLDALKASGEPPLRRNHNPSETAES